MSNNRFSHMPDPHIEEIRQVSYSRKQAEYQYFPEEYFTGSDITIYFGDTWVDEITGLSFALHEPVKPLYGYASYSWDAVARGSRLVEGQFRIAFKEAGYLHVILDHLGQLGDKAKPRLAYLMGDEKVPNWIAGVKDNIEDLLYRYHGNPNAKKPDRTRQETFLDVFEWPTLRHVRLDSKMTDKQTPNRKGRKRQGIVNGKHSHKGAQYLGCISQLQSRLIELGYGWGPWRWQEGINKGRNLSWSIRSRPASSAEARARYRPKDPWYLVSEYNDNNNALNRNFDKGIHWVRELQKRLSSYPGENENFFMGSGNNPWDGKYGARVSKGVNFFQDLCLAPNNSRAKNGKWLSGFVYEELRKGLAVTGVFDTPTRIAVMLYQRKNGLKMDGVVGKKTREKLSPNGTRTIKIPGKSLYNPDKLFEPRAAQYEAEVWGRASSADKEHKRRTFFYYRNAGGEYLRKHGFDIYITYGPYPERVIKQRGQMATKLRHTKVNFNTTVKAIRNIQITGVTQILDASGQPVEEVYNFIAKDLD